MEELDNIYKPLIALVISLAAIFGEFLGSKKPGFNLIRGIEICEDAFVEKINEIISNIPTHFKIEIDRILATAFKLESLSEIGDLNIDGISCVFDKGNYRYLSLANKYRGKLKFYYSFLKKLRWLFFVLILTNIVIIIDILFIKLFIPVLAIKILFGFTMLMVLLLVLVFIRSSSIIDDVREKYGISF